MTVLGCYKFKHFAVSVLGWRGVYRFPGLYSRLWQVWHWGLSEALVGPRPPTEDGRVERGLWEHWCVRRAGRRARAAAAGRRRLGGPGRRDGALQRRAHGTYGMRAGWPYTNGK